MDNNPQAVQAPPKKLPWWLLIIVQLLPLFPHLLEGILGQGDTSAIEQAPHPAHIIPDSHVPPAGTPLPWSGPQTR